MSRSSKAASTATVEPLIADLQAALSPQRVLHSGAEKALYAKDASATTPATPEVVCLPESAAEVQACVRIANRHGRDRKSVV